MRVADLDERLTWSCAGAILHRVTDPVTLLRALADVLEPGGEIVLETYGSRLPPCHAAIEVHARGDVYAGDDFVYWGFAAEALRRMAQIAGLGEITVLDEPEIDGHPRIVALLRPAR